MALINCPNCNGTVSDEATFCPHCDFELQTQLQEAPQPEVSKKKLTFAEKIRSIKTWKLITPLIVIFVISIGIVAYDVYSNYVEKTERENAKQRELETHLADCEKGTHEYELQESKRVCLTTATDTYKCKYCGKTNTEKSGYVYHDFDKNKKCSRCGLQVTDSNNIATPKKIFEISDIDKYEESLYTCFTGTIENLDNRNHKFVAVKVKLKLRNSVVDSEWAYAVGAEGIGPGEKARFEIYYTGDAYWLDYEIELLDYQ